MREKPYGDLGRKSARCEGGSGEPLFGYYPNATNKQRMMRTSMTCRIMDDAREKENGAEMKQYNEATQMCNFAIGDGDGKIL